MVDFLLPETSYFESVGDVFVDSCAEEGNLLEDHGDLVSDLISVAVIDFHAIEVYLSSCWHVESCHDSEHGGFAGAIRSHYCEGFTLLDLKTYVL